ncbi:MAG TPA: hypothetical protein VJ692_03940 [Nitrospiraceae bacterium]|nr:hypothetical protein [Nitrospiraceae bacterium]
MIGQAVGRAGGAVLVIALTSLSLSGCDYWPPALQAQIEQMQVDAQIATAERAKLQSQLADTMKMKEELQIRVDELTRSNREYSGRVTTLEQNLASEREKAHRLARGSAKPAQTRSMMKAAHKSPKKAMKTSPAHSSHKRRP